MKIAIFYEGDSEGILLKFLMINYCSNINYTEDVLDFIASTADCVLMYNCGGYQNVFPNLQGYSHIHSPNCSFLAVRDTEKTPCFTSLKDEGHSALDKLATQAEKWAIFAKPNLESLYRADLALFERCVKKLFEETHGHINYPADFQTDIGAVDFTRGKSAVEALFSKYQISFNKKRIANKFFSQFDFQSSSDPYFVRLRESLQVLGCVSL